MTIQTPETTEVEIPMTSEQAYDATEADIASLMDEFEAAAGNTPEMLRIAAILLDAQGKLPGLLVAKNSGAIQDASDLIKASLTALVGASSYEELTGDPIMTVLMVRVPEQESPESGPIYELQLNPTKVGARKSTPSSGAKGKSGDSVSRVGPNGNTETMTIKEMVQLYATPEAKDLSLYKKSAWSSMMARVNADLVKAGSNEFTPVIGVTPASTESEASST